MPDEQKKYGKRISKSEGDAIFSSFQQLKVDSHAALQTAFSGKPDPLRYYCGRSGTTPLDDQAFVFDRDCLLELIEKLQGDDPMADGIIVFNGIRNDGVSGRPTVMLFPYLYEDRDSNKKILVITDQGVQHPGSSSKAALKNELPSEFEIGETYE